MKDAFYFPHDSNAKDDPKCSILLEQLGCEGYGIFWILIETLREQPNYRYPMGLLPVIARKYNTTHEKVRVVVGNYGLFSIDADEFFSLSLNRRMEQVEQIRNINRMKGIKSGEARRLLALTTTKQTVVEPKLNSGSTVVEQKKGKETKLKKVNSKVSEELLIDLSPLETALQDFRQMRNLLKNPLTDRAEKLLLDKLNRMATTDEEKIEILNQSTMNSWKGVFELKDKPKQQSIKDFI